MDALLRISLYKGGGFRLSLRPAPQGVAKSSIQTTEEGNSWRVKMVLSKLKAL